MTIVNVAVTTPIETTTTAIPTITITTTTATTIYFVSDSFSGNNQKPRIRINEQHLQHLLTTTAATKIDRQTFNKVCVESIFFLLNVYFFKFFNHLPYSAWLMVFIEQKRKKKRTAKYQCL